MPEPIDFTRVNIGFQDQRESLTDFTKGYPISNEGAVRNNVPVATGHTDVHDGMVVVVNSDGEAEKATTTTSIQDLALAADTYATFNGTAVQSSKKITLLTQNYEFKTQQLADENLTLQANAHPIEDTAVSVGFSTLTGVSHTIDGSETYTLDGGSGAVVNLDADFSAVSAGDRIHFPAITNSTAQTYTILAVTYNNPDTDITIDSTGEGLLDIQDPTTGPPATAYTGGSEAGFAADYDTAVVTFSTPNSKLVVNGASSTLTLYALDYSDEIRNGDQVIVTSPSTWDDDRDSSTVEITATQAAQTIIPTTVALSGSDTVITFNIVTTAMATPGTTAYDAATDVYFSRDFTGGAITFNRVAADLYVGLAVGADAGKIAILAGATEQIVGHVIGTDPLLRTVTIRPYKY